MCIRDSTTGTASPAVGAAPGSLSTFPIQGSILRPDLPVASGSSVRENSAQDCPEAVKIRLTGDRRGSG